MRFYVAIREWRPRFLVAPSAQLRVNSEVEPKPEACWGSDVVSMQYKPQTMSDRLVAATEKQRPERRQRRNVRGRGRSCEAGLGSRAFSMEASLDNGEIIIEVRRSAQMPNVI
jgi:hypothetical protein